MVEKAIDRAAALVNTLPSLWCQRKTVSSHYQGGDPADYPQASVGFDYDAIDESLGTNAPVKYTPEQSSLTPAEALFKFIAFIIDSSDYMREIDVAIAAIGFPIYQGSSYTALAKKHSISKQAFDKHVLRFQKNFQLPVTRAQKSPQARSSYRKTQLDRQQRLAEVHEQTKQQQERAELVWQNSSRKVPKEP